jgi:hypothetical protein
LRQVTRIGPFSVERSRTTIALRKRIFLVMQTLRDFSGALKKEAREKLCALRSKARLNLNFGNCSGVSPKRSGKLLFCANVAFYHESVLFFCMCEISCGICPEFDNYHGKGSMSNFSSTVGRADNLKKMSRSVFRACTIYTECATKSRTVCCCASLLGTRRENAYLSSFVTNCL